MMKVGLVTLWKRNYGSALQCYATKSAVEKLGYRCVPLFRTFPGVLRYTYYVGELFRVAANSARYKNYLTNYVSLRAAGKKSICSLSAKSESSLDQFVQTVLQPEGYSYIRLKEIGKSEEFAAFIAGSDQIWNGARRYDPVSFLEFVPNKKKIALAPSFGTEIEIYNKKPFARAIKKFQYLSAREQDGAEKINDLTGRKAVRLSDPTALLSPNEWRDFSNSAKSAKGDYIFLHFLDTPCDDALIAIDELRNETGFSLVAFAYPHEEYNRVEGIRFYDGGVQEYVKYIDHARYVMTDSFHTTLFSIYFDTPFFTFHRQYMHNASQTSRITNLLSLYGLEERLVADINTFRHIWNSKMEDCTVTREKEREKLTGYIKKSLANT